MDDRFYNTFDLFPELKIIDLNIETIEKELYLYDSNKSKWIEWPEKDLYNENEGWVTIPIYGFDHWSKQSKYFPNLVKYIKSIPNVKLVTFSKLKPGVVLKEHYGWGFYSNHVIRNHFGIVVPDKCAVVVDNETHNHHKHKWLTFDDSKKHYAYNLSNSDRIVLIIDIERPSYIKTGISNSEDVNELKDFIDEHKIN